MEIKENSKLQDRRHFLLRAISSGYKTKEECQDELDSLEKEIQVNVVKVLQECKENMITEVETMKKEIQYDGNFKRGVANYIIKILNESLTNDELKGVFRQGYKIMRGM